MIKVIRNYVIGIIIFIIAIVVWNLSAYTVKENEYAVIRKFGAIQTVVDEPGLHFRIPFAETVQKISTAKQLYDLPASEVITSDNKIMVADAYIVWHVSDPVLFTKTLNANPTTAEGRIDVIVFNSMKTTISSMTQEELIASRDVDFTVTDNATDVDGMDNLTEGDETEDVEIIAISEKIMNYIGDQCTQYGVEIDTIEIKALDLPSTNKSAVYERMISERNNIAAYYTAQGESDAQLIRNQTDREVAVTISEAEAEAEALRAEGEAEYMRILSEVYNDPDKAEFYLFVLQLENARNCYSNSDEEITLFLDADSPLAQIFMTDFSQ